MITTRWFGPSTFGGSIQSKTSGPLARDSLLKPTGPRGRFFLSAFRDAWPVVWCRWRRFPARGAPVVGAGGAGFRHVARRPWCAGRGALAAGRGPWFGGADVCISTNKQGPPAPSHGLWIE